ncbi:hypothetical protein PVT68_11055 [Microbulbifer bruguierae]|uniref:Transmembrane protein n=1 Tax=Microbulbifer bruguierae TaxID=3029061 RepID=A0ABY8NB50_9GAMM|nr:hypothetical protein [Microbulbifer bruguierae]WGL15307.1 hypothetical protein PVT68_11055 [Microbulbifer bruguierae]
MAENLPIETVVASNRSETQPARLNRFAGIGVLAAVALPIIAAYIVFYTGVGMPMGKVNQGELLSPPLSISDIELLSSGGKRVDLSLESPKWRYLIVTDDKCAGECEKLLYTTRQVHIRLGEKASRVERLLITSEPLSAAYQGELASQHPRLHFATVDSQQIDLWLANSDHANLKRPSTLLLDQRGFAMMVYDNRHSGNQLLKDIKRLLKYSYEQ